MKLLTTIVLTLLSIFCFSLGASRGPLDSKHKVYGSTHSETQGLIGVTEDSPVDNPADNIFHVNINALVCEEDNAWLVYELEGVEDHTAVSRSINDQLAVGGYLGKKRRGWATQREQIRSSWLKEGDNVIRFTIPENAAHNYRIRNVHIEVEQQKETTTKSRVIFNQPSSHYFFNKAYIKGLVLGSDQVRIKVEGKDARIFNGEFESVIDFQSAQSNCMVRVEAIQADGSSSCYTLNFSEPQLADYEYAFENTTYRTEKIFDVNKTETISLNGAHLNVGSEALEKLALLSITSLRSIDIPALDAGMVNVTNYHSGFRFLPHGTVFKKATGLTIPFDPEKIPDGYTEKDIKTYYFDELTHHWIPLPQDSVLMEQHEVISRTTHFTDMINAIIKVPESPEAEAYNSTSMKGIKAANPTAAVNLINPPQANNTGNASLSYPINIPAGRHGMQPQIGISYTSGGGNGWLGLGWNLVIPSISIETRWGVPRYDDAKETETYTMSGEMLTPVAHRDELQPRTGNKKTFYPRVEGAFNKIERHGSSPAQYHWVVTDKSGTKYFYGATGGGEVGTFDNSAVLRDNEKADAGNIAQWYLNETRDLNGNSVRYHYVKVEDTGLDGGSVAGYQMYIKKITYTGRNGSDGRYSVVFTRDRELGENKRADVTITANLGFKEVTADLLRKIEVQFDDKNIRSYMLNYKTGAFFKTLLTNIQEFDTDGKIFTTHNFDYYDDVDFKNGYKPFKKPDPWQVGDDGKIRGNFIKRIEDKFDDNASMLSGTKSTDNSFGMAATVGFNVRVWDKTLSVGGSYNSSTSETESILTTVDLNGDGLPDKVFLKGGTLHYRPNLSIPGEGTSFGDAVQITKNTGEPISTFFKEKSKTKTGGLEAHGPASAPLFGGYSRSKTTSEESVYFTEVNGDQLPDLVMNGKVFFTRINSQTGRPEFVENSGLTPSPIHQGSDVAAGKTSLDETQYQQALRENPLHDVVRMWEAPYTGHVKIAAPVQLVAIYDNEREETPADGVRVAIQLNATEVWHDEISATDYGLHMPTGVSDLYIEKGQRLYFRVGSRFNGAYDQVNWTPVIEYTQWPFKLKEDVNRKSYVKFDSKQDFKQSAIQKVSPPEKGKVAIQSKFVKPVTTDDLYLEIIREITDPDAEDPNVVISTDTLWTRKYGYAGEITYDTILYVDVDEGHHLQFKLRTSTNVDWKAVDWKPRVWYTELADPKFKDEPLYDSLNNPIIEISPIPEYTMYNREYVIGQPYKVWGAQDTVKIKVEPVPFIADNLIPFPAIFSGEIYFSVKKKNALLMKDTIRVAFNKIVSTSKVKEFKVLKNDSLFFEFHAPHLPPLGPGKDLNLQLVDYMLSSNVKVTVNDTIKTPQVGIHGVTRKFDALNRKVEFGPMYHQWGQFAYLANGDRATQPINQSDLFIREDLKDTKQKDPNDFKDGNDLNADDTYKPYDEKFIIMIPVAKQQRWIGFDNETWVSATGISSSRLGENDPKEAASSSQPNMGSGAKAINKKTESTANSYSLGASAGFIGGSVTASDGKTKVISDFMDFNGDRYPDVVLGNRVQFTDAQGGLSDKVFIHDKDYNMESIMHSEGASLSGSMTTSKSEGGLSFNIKKAAVVSIADGKGSVGLSVNGGTGHNETDFSWIDINGDGLPDKVSQDGTVKLNLGYKFSDPEKWNHNAVQNGQSISEGAGLGLSLWNGSISGGIGLARSDNWVTSSMQDVNGDGLTDLVGYIKDQPLSVRFNTGNAFAAPISWKGAFHIGESSSTTQSVNVAFTIGIYIPIANIKITVNPSYSTGHGASRELSKLADMNGDGFPDYVHSTKYDNLTVATSTIGKTNLLKSVKRPLGASFEMTYSRIGNTYDVPHSVWAMDSVKVYDGFAGDGVDKMLTTFSYEDGFHDRHERDFYGFKKVITKSHDTANKNEVYTIATQTYKNNNYYEKGLLVSELMTDGKGNKFVEKENVYQLKDIFTGADLTSPPDPLLAGNAFPSLKETKQKFFEGQAQAGKNTSISYGYDAKGNVTSYIDLGDEGNEDDITAQIAYHNVESKYIVGTPKIIAVTGSGVLLRKREAVIDENTGDVKQIKQYLKNTEFAQHDIEYDEYGNLKKITRPANKKGQRMSMEYEYDVEVHTYTTKVKNSYGYSSEGAYDVRFGQILSSKDLNGNEIKYELDALGRVKNITGPYEKGGANKTIEFEYHPEATVPWALTNHFDPANNKNKMQTAIFVDGLGRVLQTKKDVAIYAGEAKADIEMMTVSGRVVFDAFGRIVKAFYPVTENVGTPGTLNAGFDTVKPTETTYDVLNRTLTVTLPDGAQTKTEYGFNSDRDSKNQFSTKTTDANGKQTEQFTDVKGRVTSVKNYTSDKSIWTSFKYNAISEQIEATDDLGHTTFSFYDNLGRRTSRKHPDAGETRYSYDLAGNLTQLETANLLKDGLAIEYSYDFERLMEITYPQNPENNVKYTYGEAGASDNRAGRIVLQEDATGAQEFFYGPLGEVVKNIRTVIIPQFGEQTYTTEWTYDTWNRLTSMTYADGEKVDYTYNVGGLLNRMDGKKKSSTFSYVKQLGYDKFEQRVFLAYGNGTKTTYNYEPDRRRLKNMTAQTTAKRLFMDNTYTYDKVNNILSLENKAPIPSSNLMGGSSDYHYSYDDLYRLTSATGNYKGANEEHTYTLSMNYNSVGGITQKTQQHLKKGQEQKKTTYNLAYTYSDSQPHAPSHIGEQTFNYDANGNQLGWKDDVSGQRRNIIWDEENRLRAVKDNGAYYHYTYDAAGERILKGQSTGQRIFVNGEWKAGSGQMGNYTVYVNPYIVLKSGGYTKHYYIEGQRIVSKLGGGIDNNGQGPLKAGGSKVNYAGREQLVFDGIVKNLKFLGADGQILTAGKSGKVPPGQVKGTGNIAEAFRYFYHPDHLGSTSYVTDASGEVYQHLEYFAFGETFVEEHSNTDRTPYLFNGKELDEETGLYYYGARYYDPKTSVWQSMDPMAEKYPGLSPYNYTANNPINFIDPNGQEIVGTDGEKVTYTKGKDGSVKWTDNASDDTKRLGNAMLKTKEGQESLDKIIGSKTRVTLKLDNSKSPDGKGYAETNGDFKNLNDDGTFKEATMTIFLGELQNDNDPNFNEFVKVYEGAKDEEFLNAIGSHEQIHLTPEQIRKDDKRREEFMETMTAEKGPSNVEYRARVAYRKTMGLPEIPLKIAKQYRFYGVKVKEIEKEYGIKRK